MERKLNICMLLPTPRYGSNMRVQPQIGICSYLTNFGHNVDWIIWSDDSCQVQPFFFKNSHVIVTPQIKYFRGNSFYGKMLNRIPNLWRRGCSILKIFNTKKYSIIFVRNNEFDGLIAAYIKRRYKIPFVFELSSPLEQKLESLKTMPKTPKWFFSYGAAKVGNFIAAYLLQEADLILPTTKWFKEYLIEKGISEPKIMSYPNGINVKSFEDRCHEEVLKKYNLNDSKIILYVGTLGKLRKLELLIRAFSIVTIRRKDAKLLIVGEGDDEENLKKLARELGIDGNVFFTGQVAQDQIPDFIAAADMGISPVPPFSFYKMSSPIKMFEYMGLGKPVIANQEIPEHMEVLEQSGGGILVPFVPEAFADAIIKLLDNPDEAAQIGQRGKEWVLKNRTYEILARKLEQKLFELL